MGREKKNSTSSGTVTEKEDNKDNNRKRGLNLLGIIKNISLNKFFTVIIVSINLISLFIFILSAIKNNFILPLVIIFVISSSTFLLLLFKDPIYRYIFNNQKVRNYKNLPKNTKLIEKYTFIQILFFIVLWSGFLLIFSRNYPKKIYEDMSNYINPVIETKLAINSQYVETAPIISHTLSLSNISSDEEQNVSRFILDMFDNLLLYLNDPKYRLETNISKYFCEDIGDGFKNIENNYIEKIQAKYPSIQTEPKLSCEVTIDPNKIYDRGVYWRVEVENRCEIITPPVNSMFDDLIAIEVLKPSGYRKDYCIYTFNLVFSEK